MTRDETNQRCDSWHGGSYSGHHAVIVREAWRASRLETIEECVIKMMQVAPESEDVRRCVEAIRGGEA